MTEYRSQAVRVRKLVKDHQVKPDVESQRRIRRALRQRQQENRRLGRERD